MNFLKSHRIPERKAIVAGNSVGVDKSFIDVHMPLLREFLHYRVIDVSSIKELAIRWNKNVLKELPKKSQKHRAKEDILESIAELKHYKQSFFKLSWILK